MRNIRNILPQKMVNDLFGADIPENQGYLSLACLGRNQPGAGNAQGSPMSIRQFDDNLIAQSRGRDELAERGFAICQMEDFVAGATKDFFPAPTCDPFRAMTEKCNPLLIVERHDP
jgi:hypothetical protein